MSFICIIIKNHFHINGFALSLALKVRFLGTRKWPIGLSKQQFCMCSTPLVCFLAVPARPRREISLCDVFLEHVNTQIINNNSVPNSVQIIIQFSSNYNSVFFLFLKLGYRAQEFNFRKIHLYLTILGELE